MASGRLQTGCQWFPLLCRLWEGRESFSRTSHRDTAEYWRTRRINSSSLRSEGAIGVGASAHLMTSPSRTLRLLRTTLFMRTFSSEQVSSDSTIHTVSRLFFPFISTVSPRKSWSSSILVWTRQKLFHTLRSRRSTTNVRFKTPLPFYLWERDHTVVFIDGFIYDESVGSVLLFQNRSG